MAIDCKGTDIGVRKCQVIRKVGISWRRCRCPIVAVFGIVNIWGSIIIRKDAYNPLVRAVGGYDILEINLLDIKYLPLPRINNMGVE